MPITYGQAKQLLAEYVGRGGSCPTAEKVDLFTRKVLEYMLISGTYGNLRKFCFCAVKGCITVPYELQTPEKIIIDGRVGTVWDKWFEFHADKNISPDCLPAERFLIEEPNSFATVYDLPPQGSQVGIVGTCNEAADAHVIVKGVDTRGREVITYHKGEKISGEYLSIKKNEVRYSSTIFKKITAVIKTPTVGYCQLYWVDPRPQVNGKGFLAEYSPVEERPWYRRFRVTSPTCGAVSQVVVLGRIRLKEKYFDNDYIPFETLYTIELAGQAVYNNYNDNPAVAQAKDGMMQDMIVRENEYKRPSNGQPIEVYYPTSAGAIMNIVGGFDVFGAWRRG